MWLPITARSSEAARLLEGKHLNAKKLKQLFFLNDDFDEDVKKNKTFEAITVYSGSNATSVASSFAHNFGEESANFRGKRISGDDLEEFGGEVFNSIIKPYDRQLSDVAAEVAPFNILHICESGGHFTPETFNDYLDYPGSVINPPLHNWKDKSISLADISRLFHRPVLGGLNNRSQALKDGNLAELKAEVDEILKNAPANFIFGADDSVFNDVDQETLRKLVDYIHTWRQTHKK